MSMLQVFLVAFVVSYIGSIPPGLINISVMQMSIQGHRAAALMLGLGAIMIEFLYAAIAITFLQLFQNNDTIYLVLQIVTAFGLIGLGISNYLSNTTSKSVGTMRRFRKRAAFTKGLLLGLLNPLTIPFWLGVTTYLLSTNWISLDGHFFWTYLAGLAVGTYILLITVDILGSKFQKISDNKFVVHKLPGILFTSMGLYYLVTIWGNA